MLKNTLICFMCQVLLFSLIYLSWSRMNLIHFQWEGTASATTPHPHWTIKYHLRQCSTNVFTTLFWNEHYEINQFVLTSEQTVMAFSCPTEYTELDCALKGSWCASVSHHDQDILMVQTVSFLGHQVFPCSFLPGSSFGAQKGST